VLAIGCTAAQRNQALMGVGVGVCGGGKAASALDQGWGAALEAVGCWLADWAAEREDRRSAAEAAAKAAAEQGLELAPVEAPLEPIDEAAIELDTARARMVAQPCEANYNAMIEAYERCKLLESEGQ